MKTTVLCATILCLELVSSYPFPEPLLSYYGSYEPVGVPERVITQPIQISNLARSQNSELAYQQQQLAYLQQENIRRQNYENLLRNQEQQRQVAAINQRLAEQLLSQSQPEQNYNNAIPLNTVQEPYINSVTLQLPIQQRQYEAPITQQYYENQQFREPYQNVEAPQQYNVANTEPQAVAESVSPAQPNYSYNQQYQPGPRSDAKNLLYDSRIRQVLASTPLKKRYLVLHPNGTIEHIDKIENIIQRHPNYILVNAGNLPKPNEYVAPSPVNPQPVAPAPETQATAGPAAPVAPLTPVVPPTPSFPTVPPSTPLAPSPVQSVPNSRALPGALPPPIIQNGTVPGPKPTVQPPTGSTTTAKSVTAQTALQPQPLSTTLAPPPFVTATATAVYPTVVPLSTTPLPPTVTTANSTVTTLSVATATATAVYPPPSDPISTTSAPPDVTTAKPTVTPPSVVTATATAVYPPSGNVTTPTPDVANATVTPAPVVNGTAIPVSSQSFEATTCVPTDVTTATSVSNQRDAVGNGTGPGPKPTVQPPTGSTTTAKSVTAQTALQPQPVSTTLKPPPFATATATAVYPTAVPLSTTPLPPTVTTANSTVTTPSVVTATATAVYPPPSDPISTTSAPPAVTTAKPTVTPTSVVTATATAVYPPSGNVTTPTPDVANATVTPAPVVNGTAIPVPPQSFEAATCVPTDVTTATPVANQPDAVANATVATADSLTPDFPFAKSPTEPVVWFRTKNWDFWDKLTSGNETYDVVYFFNIVHPPRVTKDNKTVIFANGTVVEELTETTYDDEDEPPRVIKTTKITNPDDTKPKT